MRFIEIPEIPRIHGKEAVQALNEFIIELKEQKSKELTRKQKAAMIKFAKGLICSIEAEMQAKASDKAFRRGYFVKKLKKTVKRHISDLSRARNNSELKSNPVNSPLRFSTRATSDCDILCERTWQK